MNSAVHRPDPAPARPGTSPRPGEPDRSSGAFDLRDVETRFWAHQRGRRAQTLGVALVGPVLAAVAGYLALGWGPGSLHFLGYLLLAALVLAMSIATVRYSGLSFSRGPVRLDVGPEGFEVERYGGRRQSARWRDPKLRLRLADFRGIPTPYRREVPWEATWGGESFALSGAAADALLDRGRRSVAAVWVREYEGLPGWKSRFYDLRGTPSSAPGQGWVADGPGRASP